MQAEASPSMEEFLLGQHLIDAINNEGICSHQGHFFETFQVDHKEKGKVVFAIKGSINFIDHHLNTQ